MSTFTEEIFISDVFIVIAARKDHGQTYVNFSYDAMRLSSQES